mgnify:FL=1
MRLAAQVITNSRWMMFPFILASLPSNILQSATATTKRYAPRIMNPCTESAVADEVAAPVLPGTVVQVTADPVVFV